MILLERSDDLFSMKGGTLHELQHFVLIADSLSG